jgi:hypothetical protein
MLRGYLILRGADSRSTTELCSAVGIFFRLASVCVSVSTDFVDAADFAVKRIFFAMSFALSRRP